MSGTSKATLFMHDQATPPRRTDPGPASLVFIHPPGPNLGRRFELVGAQLVLGREERAVGLGAPNDLAIDTESVSRRHARLVHDADGWVVEDLGSTNGTFVNDQPARRQCLQDGDLIRFGAAVAKFLSGDNIEASYHEEIYRLTIVDGLTGAHNKRYLLDFLERELAASSRYGLPLSVVRFDVDHFKRVNDVHGHLAGDAVLRQLSHRIAARMRREDLFARYGGEEFACVLVRTGVAGAVRFAETLREIVAAERIVQDGSTIAVTISLGVAELWLSETETAASDLIALADGRLYRAKREGRNRVVAT